MLQTFRSLESRYFRVWLGSVFVSNMGTWLQRTAQDWLVIAFLSKDNATAIGIVVLLQYIPQLVLSPFTGFLADYIDRARLLFITQLLLMSTSLTLGILAVSELVTLNHLYLLALIHGVVVAFDIPARHAFVSDIVSEKKLTNAVSLNSVSFNSARLIGPAIAGVLIASTSTGWVILMNAMSYIPMLCCVLWFSLKSSCVFKHQSSTKGPNKISDGFVYISSRREMVVALAMVSCVCVTGMSFAVYLSSINVNEFHGGAMQYGLLVSMMAVGSITGAVLTASLPAPTVRRMIYVATAYAVACFCVAMSDSMWMFCITLVFLGMTLQLMTTSVNAFMQISSDKRYKGRVMAVAISVILGSTALGGPIVGWLCDEFGGRYAIGLGALLGIIACIIGIVSLSRSSCTIVSKMELKG
ncbi:MFS transporter [Marinomonas balearica]|uniref:Putative MFS family arabinose efflux permease n=1 Tax=Marinomonas balearica TaxID=491947 RepID=A0A4R6MIT8_9GAMM|nr:MFS transporter [Marinomonas balearica]TDP01918.1 putative MFS family arabinose efflux permease [Marinomonas balearica]